MDLKGKKLLIQGAGRGHLGLIEAAKRLGVFTIVTGLSDKYPCVPLADKVCYADITDKEKVLDIAKQEKIDGILICCSDTGLSTVGHVCDALNLSGITEKSANLSSNKYLMKQALIEKGVNTAEFRQICNLENLYQADKDLTYPLIIKAVDLQGSKGVYVVNNYIELKERYEEIKLLSKKDYCIVEEFIKGKEFGAQAFVYKGEVMFVLPHGDEVLKGDTSVPIGHYMPFEDTFLYEEIERQAKSAIEALGLNNCAVNIDFIQRDGKVYIIELTGRVGANCLPEITSYYLGINYYDMIIYAALGLDPRIIYNRRDKGGRYVVSRMIKTKQSGIIKELDIPSVKNGYIRMFVSKDSEVRKFSNSNDAVGELVLFGNSFEELEVKQESIFTRINIELL